MEVSGSGAYGLDDALPNVLVGCAAILVVVFAILPRMAESRRAEHARCLDALVAHVESRTANATCPISGAPYSTGDTIACTNTHGHGRLVGAPCFVRRTDGTYRFVLALDGPPLNPGESLASGRMAHVRDEPDRVVVDTHASPLTRWALAPVLVALIAGISLAAVRNRPIWTRGGRNRRIALVALVLLANPCFLVPLLEIIRTERIAFAKGRATVTIRPRYFGLPLASATVLEIRAFVALEEPGRRHVFAIADGPDGRVRRELVALGTEPDDGRALASIARAAATGESKGSPTR